MVDLWALLGLTLALPVVLRGDRRIAADQRAAPLHRVLARVRLLLGPPFLFVGWLAVITDSRELEVISMALFVPVAASAGLLLLILAAKPSRRS